METKTISKRNSNIELLRFLFCWNVVFLHANFPGFAFGGGISELNSFLS